MAKRNQNNPPDGFGEMATGEGKSLEQIQHEIASLDLQTKQLNYAEAKRKNELFIQHEEQRHRHNRQRQGELAQIRASAQAVVNGCRHKSGGSPKNILRGGGIGSFSIISRALMPDGVTVFLQCARCRMKEYFRKFSDKEESRLKKGNEEMHEHYLKVKKFYDMSVEIGLEHAELRGPTFFFQDADTGVPLIPQMV